LKVALSNIRSNDNYKKMNKMEITDAKIRLSSLLDINPYYMTIEKIKSFSKSYLKLVEELS